MNGSTTHKFYPSVGFPATGISARGITLQMLLAVTLLLAACTAPQDDEAPTAHIPLPQGFNDYWYAGEAELNHFDLRQARYGEMRDGSAIMIFVTEDFLTGPQVKKEHGDGPAVSVLKLNFIKRFVTGIYDYSMMTSVFSPLNSDTTLHALKTSATSQDWCGHTFVQLNRRGRQYEVSRYSYFQLEADRHYTVPVEWQEDELWNLIRIDPEMLPQGRIRIIPPAMTARLMHQRMEPAEALAAITHYAAGEMPGEALRVYTLTYPEPYRELKIFFETAFPHAIAGWEETYRDGWGENAKMLSTKAVRTRLMKGQYWNQNPHEYERLRDTLGMKPWP